MVSWQDNSNPGYYGTYTYELQFNLPPTGPIIASLSGSWAADNSGSINLNGSPTGVTAPDGNQYAYNDPNLNPFTISSGFQPGWNKIDFLVNQPDGYDGLRVRNLILNVRANHFLVAAPASTTAGAPFSVTITALDAYNSVDTGYTGTVHFSSSDPLVGLPANYTFTAADQGVHTFTNQVTLKKAGARTITVTDTANKSITGKATVNVQAAAASHFGITAPSSATAGSSFTITIAALDPYGNTDPTYRGTATFASSDLLHPVLPTDYPFTAADAGKHTFTGGALLKTAGNQSITVTDTQTSSIMGHKTIKVVPGAAVTLLVAGFPSSTGVRQTNLFYVIARDAYGNTATGYRGTINFSSNGPATLPANYTFTASDKGQHVFAAAFDAAGTWDLSATDTINLGITGTEGGIQVN